MAILGAVLITLATAFKAQTYQPTDFVNQVAADWQTVPFVNITITDDFKCANDTELVFNRMWYGTRQGCYCSSGNPLWSVARASSGTVRAGFKLDRSCTYDELNNRKNHLTCWDVPA